MQAINLQSDQSPRLVSRGGASACLNDAGEIELRNADGELRVVSDGDVTRIVATGDLVLDAPNGSVTVRAKKDVVLESEGDIAHRAKRIHLEADQLFEKTRDTIREVSALLLTRAGRVRSLVRAGYSLTSRRTSIKSERETSIDGKRVLLG